MVRYTEHEPRLPGQAAIVNSVSTWPLLRSVTAAVIDK